MNLERSTTCRYYMPYVLGYVVPDVVPDVERWRRRRNFRGAVLSKFRRGPCLMMMCIGLFDLRSTP
jgi:hypothetical protein